MCIVAVKMERFTCGILTQPWLERWMLKKRRTSPALALVDSEVIWEEATAGNGKPVCVMPVGIQTHPFWPVSHSPQTFDPAVPTNNVEQHLGMAGAPQRALVRYTPGMMVLVGTSVGRNLHMAIATMLN